MIPRPENNEYSLSVFFPAYNDAPSLPALLETTFQVLPQLTSNYEVIVVNDGSQDETARILAEQVSKYCPHLRVVTHRTNRGYGGALRSGFAACSKELIFYTDGDGQYDVGELPKLWEQMRHSVGLVNGYKLERNDPWHRILIGTVYNGFARVIFGIRIRDIDCDFRLIRRQLLSQIELHSTSGAICLELVKKLELCAWLVQEVGVHHRPRKHGRSEFFRYRSLLTTLAEMMWLYTRLIVAPTFNKKDRKLA